MALIVLVGSDEELRAGKGRRALTASEAAGRLKVGERLFRKLVETGEISPHEEQIGNVKFYEEYDIEELRQRRLRRY